MSTPCSALWKSWWLHPWEGAFGQPVVPPARPSSGWPGLGLWRPLDVRVTPCSRDTRQVWHIWLDPEVPCMSPRAGQGQGQPVSYQESEEKRGESGMKALSLRTVHCLPLEWQPRVGLSRVFLIVCRKNRSPESWVSSKLGAGGHPARNVHGQPEWVWISCWTQVKASPESPTPALTMSVTNTDP